jgi:dienelactone hydrolase
MRTRHRRLFAAVLLVLATSFPLLRAGETVAQPAGNGAQYELIGRYDLDRLSKILTTELADFTSFPITYTPPRNAVKLYRVAYPSVIPERGNKPTTAYGLVAIPETGKQAMPMVSYQHGTVFGQHEVPSFPEQSMETRLMIAQFAGQGYVVVAADYFGLGLSTENEGFMVKGSHQQACLDMYYSARAVLEREHVQVTNFFVTGWSLGGFVTMAFLEKLESVGIPVRAASTASAPSDALVAFNGFLNFPRKIDAPWLTTIFALSSFSLEKYYGIPGLAQALINPDQYEISRKLYAREPFNMNEFPTDLHKLIRPEYFNPQYLAESAYGRLLKEAQTYRWIVKTPLRNYYGEIDEVITTGLGKLPMVYQQSIGNTQVEAFSAGPKANHRGTFAYAVAEQKKWFDSLLTR